MSMSGGGGGRSLPVGGGSGSAALRGATMANGDHGAAVHSCSHCGAAAGPKLAAHGRCSTQGPLR